MKGAAEIVLKSCNFLLNPETSQVEQISEAKRGELKQQIKNYGEQSLRNICVAYKDISLAQYNAWKVIDEEGNYEIEKEEFVFVCIAAIKDSLREGVENAVKVCQRAGINVVMITGDNEDTAFSIAKDCGIVAQNDLKDNVTISGEAFYNSIGGIECITCSSKVELCNCPRTKEQADKREMTEDQMRKEKIGNMEEFKKITKNLRVIARSRPDDKYALILGLRKLQNVVAVTGDGTNDAKALSKSDVGFAMGKMGTDIAKDAADIIILDDDFSTIVSAVKWGRTIYDNIRKFIVFQLTVNVCSVILVLVCSCIANEVPIEAIQMLWLNLIMDSLGSLSLATETPHERVLKRKPYKKNTSIISETMWKHILMQSLFLFIICLLIYLYGYRFIPENEKYRRNEIDTIYACYGYYPGHELNSPLEEDYKILSGKEVDWPESYKLLQTATIEKCGDYMKHKNLIKAFSYYKNEFGNSSHMTLVFNLFVYWSLLNQINSRVIDENFNIFYKIQSNMFFLVILTVECVLQALLVSYGSFAFKTSWKGLDATQWLICLALALFTFPASAFFKLLKIESCIGGMLNLLGKLIDIIICKSCRKKENEHEDLDNSDARVSHMSKPPSKNLSNKSKHSFSVSEALGKRKDMNIKIASKRLDE